MQIASQFQLMAKIQADPACMRVQLVFGLVLAGLSPPPVPLLRFYSRFHLLLQESLRYAGIPESAVYLYDATSLHTTVATFRSFTRPPPHNPERFVAEWNGILLRASLRAQWPPPATHVITISAAKIQENGVGTLLYFDKLRVIERMRECIRAEINDSKTKQSLNFIGCSPADIKIPNCVHSTVLRWKQTPKLSINSLQRIFSEAFVLAKAAVDDVKIPLTSVSLLREWEPYMRKRTCVVQIWSPNTEDRDGWFWKMEPQFWKRRLL